MKKLYDLEYEVEELRKQYLDYISTYNITLKEVLDLGFNNVIINNVKMYVDTDNNYIANGYFIRNDELLKAKVKYLYHNIETESYGEYLEVYCEFLNENYNDLLNDYTKNI